MQKQHHEQDQTQLQQCCEYSATFWNHDHKLSPTKDTVLYYLLTSSPSIFTIFKYLESWGSNSSWIIYAYDNHWRMNPEYWCMQWQCEDNSHSLLVHRVCVMTKKNMHSKENSMQWVAVSYFPWKGKAKKGLIIYIQWDGVYVAHWIYLEGFHERQLVPGLQLSTCYRNKQILGTDDHWFIHQTRLTRRDHWLRFITSGAS